MVANLNQLLQVHIVKFFRCHLQWYSMFSSSCYTCLQKVAGGLPPEKKEVSHQFSGFSLFYEQQAYKLRDLAFYMPFSSNLSSWIKAVQL